MKTQASAYIRKTCHDHSTITFNLHFDWSGITEEQLRKLAQQTLYVHALGRIRRERDWPEEGQTVEVLATDYIPRGAEVVV